MPVLDIYVGMPWEAGGFDVGMPWQEEEEGFALPFFLSDYVVDDFIRDLIVYGRLLEEVDVDLYDEFMGFFAMQIWQYEKDNRFYVIWMREYIREYNSVNYQPRDPDAPFEYYYIHGTCTFILPKEHCSFVVNEYYHANTRKAITIPQFRRIRDVILRLNCFTEFYLESTEDIEKCFELDPKKEKCYEIYKRKGLDCLEDYLNKHFNKTSWYRAKLGLYD